MRPGTLPAGPTSSRPAPGARLTVVPRERPRPVCQPAPTRPPSAPPLMTRPARPPLHRRARSPVSTARRRPIPSRPCPEPRAPGPDPLLPRPGRTPPVLGGVPGRPWSCLPEARRSVSSWPWSAAPGRSSPPCTWGRWRSGSSWRRGWRDLLRSAGPRSPWLLFAVGAGLCALSAVAHHPIDRMEPVHHSVRYRHARRDVGDGRSRLVPGTPEPHVSIPPLDPTARPGFGSLSDSRLPGVWRTRGGPHGLYPRYPTSRAGVRPRRTTCLSAPELRGRVSCLACAR